MKPEPKATRETLEPKVTLEKRVTKAKPEIHHTSE